MSLTNWCYLKCVRSGTLAYLLLIRLQIFNHLNTLNLRELWIFEGNLKCHGLTETEMAKVFSRIQKLENYSQGVQVSLLISLV